jgi:hypothetical protein
MNQTSRREPARGGYLFEDHEGTDLRASPRSSNDDIRRNTSIVNGGDRTEMVDCPKCRGSGMTRWGACFRCQKSGQRGKVSMRSAAASKAVKTREKNVWEAREEFNRECSKELAYMAKRADKGSTFYRGLLDGLNTYGTLTENKLAIVRADMAKDAEFWAAKRAAAPVVNISAIEALFATAVENDIKRPVFRADGLEISRAPATGRNAGALYVRRDGEYAGKIAGGKFQKVYNAPADTLDRLLAVAADPLAESVKYARKTGNCGCCGRGLVDPVSIRSGIGPICAEKWGLDWRRDAARESLRAEEE